MDLPVTRNTVRVNEPVFDAVSDHPVDCDIILPDYCPDIARVLKTEAVASIDEKSMDAGRLNVNGTFSVKIIYIPDNSHQIRCVTHETPYTHTFELKDMPDKAFARANVRVAFVNCRPVGPRRVQVRASLSVASKIWSPHDEEFISGSSNPRVEMLQKQMIASTFVGAVERQFTVREELEIGFGKPGVASVIKSDATAVVNDYKLIANKVIAKGEMLIKTLYAPEAEDDTAPGLEVMEHSIPLSQIIDLDGVDEECGCDVKFTAGIVKAEPKQDSSGDNKLIDIEVGLTAAAHAYRTQEFGAVVDAYSTQFETQAKTREIGFEHIAELIKTSEMVRQSIEIADQQLASVTDSSVTAVITDTKFDAGALEISGDMNVSIMAVDTMGGPVCIEKAMPFSMREELKNSTENMRCEPDIRVISAGYSLAGMDRIDLRIECMVEAVVYSMFKENVVSDLAVDEEHPKTAVKGKTLTLYYADGGERLWDIAKRYNTSMEAVKRENNLDADVLPERSMLLIPKKRASKV